MGQWGRLVAWRRQTITRLQRGQAALRARGAARDQAPAGTQPLHDEADVLLQPSRVPSLRERRHRDRSLLGAARQGAAQQVRGRRLGRLLPADLQTGRTRKHAGAEWRPLADAPADTLGGYLTVPRAPGSARTGGAANAATWTATPAYVPTGLPTPRRPGAHLAAAGVHRGAQRVPQRRRILVREPKLVPVGGGRGATAS